MKEEIVVDKLKIGFLGVGWIGKHRMLALKDVEDLEIAALADVNHEIAADAAQSVPNVYVGESLEDLLQQDLDGIVIATPSALHASQAIKALNHGTAVFCQKPLGRNLAETEAVVEAAAQNNKLLGVDFSYRHTCFNKVYDLVQSGALGDIYAVDLVFHNAYGPDKSWFYKPELAGGGCVLDLGVHLLDLMLWTLDFPDIQSLESRLYAQGKPLHGSEEKVEDYAVVNMCTQSGITIQLTCSWHLPIGQEAAIQARFWGTKGGAGFRNVNGSFYDFVAEHYIGTKTNLLSTPQDDWGGKAIQAWAKELSLSDDFRTTHYEYVKVAALVDRIYKRS